MMCVLTACECASVSWMPGCYLRPTTYGSTYKCRHKYGATINTLQAASDPVVRVLYRKMDYEHSKDLCDGWRWMDGWVDGWMDGRTDGWTDGWIDGWVEGMDGWTDGRMDGFMVWTVRTVRNGWMDGWMDAFVSAKMALCVFVDCITDGADGCGRTTQSEHGFFGVRRFSSLLRA